MIGLDRVLFERVRASLRGSLFLLRCAEECPPEDDADLYVIPAERIEELAHRHAPVIACGPAGRLRSAFLGGCADFLREPWAPEELGMRALAALSRRAERYRFSWGTISFEDGTLVLPRGRLPLTHHESRVLRILLHNRGAPVSRDALAYGVRGKARPAGGRSLDVHVASVRRKVRGMEPGCGRLIVSVRGQGYMIP